MKTIRPVNGGVTYTAEHIPGAKPLAPEVLARLANDEVDIQASKVVPVKTEQELLMEAELERLRAENQSLRAKPTVVGSLRVSEKGALSVYGLGRFPVTLYREQWERLLAMGEEIKSFIKANDHRLARKQ